jgi:hypothetical protein
MIYYAPFHYRQYIIKIIRKKYTINEFYIYEKIINKLFWNLKNKIKYVKLNQNIVNKTNFKIQKKKHIIY